MATSLPYIDKVLFVVDRKDLDYQTMKEYDRFEKGAANSNTSTKILQKQLENPNSRIIITTIQKLDVFISNNKGHAIFKQHMVLIFDECHRSQFGDMHQKIVKTFRNYHIFGFTGTPIFAINAGGGNPILRTTPQAFGDKLHTYTIVNAINDGNVLPFRIDFINTIKEKANINDTQVRAIDVEKAMSAPKRISEVTAYILDHFDQKTYRNQNRSTFSHKIISNVEEVASSKFNNTPEKKDTRRVNGFNSIFAVSSIPVAMKYYTEFKKQLAERGNNLSVATIFSFSANEDDPEDVFPDEGFETDRLDKTSRDFLDAAIADYNKTFSVNYDTSSDKFQNYYKDVSLRVKNREIDLLILLTQDEYENLAEDYQLPQNTLKVRRYFETTEFKTLDKKDASGQIFGYKSDGTLKNEPFYGAKNVQSGKFGTLVYIPAISKVDDHTKLSGPSVLRDLVTGILSGVDGSDTHFKKLGDSFTEFAGNMQSSATDDGRSVQAVEESLNTMISEWGIGFKLNWTPPSLNDVIKSMINPVYTDLAHDKDIAVTDIGSGFQRQLIYSIIKVGADFAAKQPKTKKETFEPDLTWIIFEEPEAFLHPPQQNELARSLQSLSRLEVTQVLVTTHSSYFVSNNLQVITGMARITKESKGISELYQVSDTDWKEIIDNNKLISQLPAASRVDQNDLKPEMEAIKYSIYLNPDRASMFFAKRVLIVEGPTEVALIHKLIDDGKINPKTIGYVIIDAVGKFNIHRFMNLLTKLGIEHSVLRDEDPGKQLHIEINQLIENSKTSLTIAIDELKPDLEGYLSLPRSNRPDRKPQNAIFNYVNGSIDSIKLTDFCKIVEDLLK